MTKIRYRKADVDGIKVFYREAGRADAPALRPAQHGMRGLDAAPPEDVRNPAVEGALSLAGER